MDDELQAQMKRYDFAVDECNDTSANGTRVWAILRVVQAQNDFAHAIGVWCDDDKHTGKRMVEEAIAERREAIAGLQEVAQTGAARLPVNPGSRTE